MADLIAKSISLSKGLDNCIGTREFIEGLRKVHAMSHAFTNLKRKNPWMLCGSTAEGLTFLSSDTDYMDVSNDFSVIQSADSRFYDKITLLMVHDQHHQGSVLLEPLNCVNYLSDENMCSNYRGRTVLSSKRFKYVFTLKPLLEMTPSVVSNGPVGTVTIQGRTESSDSCNALKCDTWPRVANEFVHRKRKYGWPPLSVIKAIISDGCYCVPVGDGSSTHSQLQWRMSFAPSEVRLVHTFSHEEVNVYALLKICYQDILSKVLDESDGKPLLCSYFIKTIMFFMKENSPPSFWTEVNLLNCFWMCFNFLIESVEQGYLCHFFLPGNNLFRKRIHGRNRHTLLQHLYTLRSKGFDMLNECPTLRLFDDPSDISPAEQESRFDEIIYDSLNIVPLEVDSFLTYALHGLSLLNQSHDDVYLFGYLSGLQLWLARKSSHHFTAASEMALDNKTMYHKRRICRHFLLFCTHLDVTEGWLTLATYYYLIGQYRIALQISQKLMQPLKPWMKLSKQFLQSDVYEQKFCEQGIPLLTKMKHAFANGYMTNMFPHEIYPPEITLERNCITLCRRLQIPPQPYSSFLSFLICHRMGDIAGRNIALSNLEAVQKDLIQGKESENPANKIVYHLLGICYEMTENYRKAELMYLSSVRQENRLSSIARDRARNIQSLIDRNALSGYSGPII